MKNTNNTHIENKTKKKTSKGIHRQFAEEMPEAPSH